MKIETRELAYKVATKSCEVLAVDITAEKLWSLVEALATILESGITPRAADGVCTCGNYIPRPGSSYPYECFNCGKPPRR